MRKKLRPSLFKGKEREPSYESIMGGLPEGVALIDEDGEVLDLDFELIAIEHEMAMRHKEIVRCRDCKGYRAGEPFGWCNTHMTAIPSKDGFCAWGERAVISDTTETELKWTL